MVKVRELLKYRGLKAFQMFSRYSIFGSNLRIHVASSTPFLINIFISKWKYLVARKEAISFLETLAGGEIRNIWENA